MKKLVLIITVCLFTLTGFSRNVPHNYYWSSDNEMLYCKKIRVTNGSIKAVLESGKRVVLPVSSVKMYRVKGKTYEKLPIFDNNRYTKKNAFMQFVTTRNGLRLFKYTTWECSTGTNPGVAKVDRYFVFNGLQYWLSVDEKNYKTVMTFFGV